MKIDEKKPNLSGYPFKGSNKRQYRDVYNDPGYFSPFTVNVFLHSALCPTILIKNSLIYMKESRNLQKPSN